MGWLFPLTFESVLMKINLRNLYIYIKKHPLDRVTEILWRTISTETE